jgi:hypothetical protein
MSSQPGYVWERTDTRRTLRETGKGLRRARRCQIPLSLKRALSEGQSTAVEYGCCEGPLNRPGRTFAVCRCRLLPGSESRRRVSAAVQMSTMESDMRREAIRKTLGLRATPPDASAVAEATRSTWQQVADRSTWKQPCAKPSRIANSSCTTSPRCNEIVAALPASIPCASK